MVWSADLRPWFVPEKRYQPTRSTCRYYDGELYENAQGKSYGAKIYRS